MWSIIRSHTSLIEPKKSKFVTNENFGHSLALLFLFITNENFNKYIYDIV